MAAVQQRWRARASGCSGALVWLLRDLRAGAGWGLVDAAGVPKAPYYFLARAWAPVAAWLVDEGVNGVRLHLANDTPRDRRGALTVELHRADGVVGERVQLDVDLAARSERTWSVEAVLGAFVDASYAYRFGPPEHDAIVARFESNDDDELVRTAFYFRAGLATDAASEVGLSAEAEPLADGSWSVTATSERLARWVAVEARGFRPSDSYFHVAPGIPHRFRLTPHARGTPLQAQLRPLNARTATRVRVPDEKADRKPGAR